MDKLNISLVLSKLLSPVFSDRSLSAIERFQLTTNVAELVNKEKSLADGVNAALASAQSMLEGSSIDEYSVRLKMTELFVLAKELQV